MIASGLLMLCGFIAFVLVQGRSLKDEKTEKQQDERGSFWVPCGVVGAAVYVVLIVVGVIGA